MQPRTHLTHLSWIVLALACLAAGPARAVTLTIHDLQFTTNTDGSGPYTGQTVDCVGGIVTQNAMLDLYTPKPRLYLQDSSSPNGWGGILFWDRYHGSEYFENLKVGDWVSFSNALITEDNGMTTITPGVGFTITVVSSGNPLPAPVLVPMDQLCAPGFSPTPAPGVWAVPNHSAEPFESMLVTVLDTTVDEVDLGNHSDNYSLLGSGGSIWGTDYLNPDRVGYYDPHVYPGARLTSVTGVFEQNYSFKSGQTGWDFYQIVTTSTEAFNNYQAVPEPASLALLLAGIALVAPRGRKPGQPKS